MAPGIGTIRVGVLSEGVVVILFSAPTHTHRILHRQLSSSFLLSGTRALSHFLDSKFTYSFLTSLGHEHLDTRQVVDVVAGQHYPCDQHSSEEIWSASVNKHWGMQAASQPARSRREGQTREGRTNTPNWRT